MHNLRSILIILSLSSMLSGQSTSTMHGAFVDLAAYPHPGWEVTATSQGDFVSIDTTDENGVVTLEIHHDFTVEIDVAVPAIAEDAHITIFNILGQQVWSGEHKIFAGNNSIHRGSQDLASGAYIFRIETGRGIFTKKALYIKDSQSFGHLGFHVGDLELQSPRSLQKHSDFLEDTEISVRIEALESARAIVPYSIEWVKTDSLDFSLTGTMNVVPLFTGDIPDSVVTGPFQLDVSGMVDNDNATVFSLLASNGGSITTSGLISWNPSIDGDTTELAVIVGEMDADVARDTSAAFTLTYDAPLVWSHVSFGGFVKVIDDEGEVNAGRYSDVKYICQDDTTIQAIVNTGESSTYVMEELPFIEGVGSIYAIEITATAQTNPQFTPTTVYHLIDENITLLRDTVHTITQSKDAHFTIRDLDDTSRVSGLMARVRDSEGGIVQTTTTDAMGIASFTDLLTGSYHLELDGGTDYVSRKTAFSIINRTTHADSIYAGPQNFTMIQKVRPIPGTAGETVVMTATELGEGMMGSPPTDGNNFLPLARNETMYLRLDFLSPQDSSYFALYLSEGDSLFGVDHSKWLYVVEFPEGEDGIDINTIGANTTVRRYGIGGVVGATLNLTEIRTSQNQLYKEIYGRAMMGVNVSINSRGSVFNSEPLNVVSKDRAQFNTRATYLQLKYDPQHTSNPIEQGYQSDFLDILPE